MIIVNFASGALFFLFYYPPTFHEKFHNRSPMQQLKKFDYVGTVLFVGGFLVFLLGLSWGGSVYPWKSAHVIATMVIGGIITIVFVLWECYANLEEPLLPIHLFKNFAWVVACILLGLGASIYYAMAVVWPQMVAVLYTDDGGASMSAASLSCASSIMINVGQIIAGFLAEPIGKTKIQCIAVLTIGGALLGAIAAATPDTKSLATGLIIVSCFFIGWNESVCLSNSGIELLDQREIGTAIGASAPQSTSPSSPIEVPDALLEAGLPASSVPAFLAGLTTSSFDGIAGLNDGILAVGMRAYRFANAHAYSTVFYTTIAFTGVALILSFFSPNVDDKMTGQIAVTLHKGEQNDIVVDEKA
ncbi:fungal trichothecene efflux pump [Lophiotrema nucula]|uniref:Fungal trichothecene efflux pump n=1 Tax=Lophiotrema nucula TaxID=690887 RepID=A0A6A5ZMJ5_9PLEO|nr:fungal trichothecene efflux pump [Lophiotrema nucula]